MSGLQFVASIVSALAWPIAAVAMAALLREALVNAIERMRRLEFPGGRVSFDRLPVYEKMAEAASKEAEPPTSDDAAIIRHEAAEFSVVEALASVAPGQAVIDAWGLLEYHLNIASGRLAPDRPHACRRRRMPPVTCRWRRTGRRPCRPRSRQADAEAATKAVTNERDPAGGDGRR